MLEAHDIHLRRNRRDVLSGVSLSLRPGELVSLIGPNGAGKSSLFAVLAGELPPDGGKVTLDGQPVRKIGASRLATLRAALEQSPSLSSPFTVAGLVALGMASVSRAAIDCAGVAAAAMSAAGVAELASRPVDLLSGGERARAHLARTLAQLYAGRAIGGGRYLLLDEPTASLDLSHQIGLMSAARSEADRGPGVLVVIHDLNLAAAFSDRIAIIRDGGPVALGTPGTVLTPGLLSEVYGSAISVERSPAGTLRITPDLERMGSGGRAGPVCLHPGKSQAPVPSSDGNRRLHNS